MRSLTSRKPDGFGQRLMMRTRGVKLQSFRLKSHEDTIPVRAVVAVQYM